MTTSHLANIKRSDLKPLAMRITQLQFDRLAAIRAVDGIPMQEHVRRSIDEYVVRLEAQALYKAPPKPASNAAPKTTPSSAKAKPQPRVGGMPVAAAPARSRAKTPAVAAMPPPRKRGAKPQVARR